MITSSNFFISSPPCVCEPEPFIHKLPSSTLLPCPLSFSSTPSHQVNLTPIYPLTFLPQASQLAYPLTPTPPLRTSDTPFVQLWSTPSLLFSAPSPPLPTASYHPRYSSLESNWILAETQKHSSQVDSNVYLCFVFLKYYYPLLVARS